GSSSRCPEASSCRRPAFPEGVSGQTEYPHCFFQPGIGVPGSSSESRSDQCVLSAIGMGVDEEGQGLLQLMPGDDGVHETLFQQEFGLLETLGELLSYGRFNDA